MRNVILKRILTLIFVFSIVFSCFGLAVSATTEESSDDISVEAVSKVEAFVTRMYEITLDRKPDASGLKYWCGQLNDKKITAAGVAYQFIFSKEFQNKIAKEKMTSKQYVTCHYKLFMDRNPEKAGLDFWVKQMGTNWNTKEKKNELFIGFSTSTEFKNICKSYGMLQGYYDPAHSTEQNTKVALFVERMYQVVLGRSSDADGLVYWTEQLLKGNLNGAVIGDQFFFSKEFKNKKLSNKEFITRLYRAFMDREPDQAGLDYWMDIMKTGAPREAIFGGFINSKEFTNICKSYGITRGSMDLPSLDVYSQIAELNKIRASEGAKAVTTNNLMQQWADIRAREIAENFAHVRKDGSKYDKVGRNLKIPFGASAENIAAGKGGCLDTLEQVLNIWMGSEGHHKNMVSTKYNRAALGRYVAKDGTVYWALVLAHVD